MYTKLKNVMQFSNEYLNDKTIEEIKAYTESVKMEMTKEDIISWLLDVAKADGVDMVGNPHLLGTQKLSDLDDNMLQRIANEITLEEVREKYKFNEKDYDMFDRALRIYKQKCLKLCTILELIESKQI